MKTAIRNIIDRIESTKEYIQSEDYANNFADMIPDQLTYREHESKQWLEEQLKTPLTKEEFEDLCYDLCQNGNHKLILEDGIEHDQTAILSIPIYEEEVDFQEYLEEMDQESTLFKMIMEYIEDETDCIINDSSPGLAYLNIGYSSIKLKPSIPDLQETLEQTREG